MLFDIFYSHDSFPKLWLRILQSLRPSVGRVAKSVQRLNTGWTVRDRNPVGTRFSARPDLPWGSPRLLYNGYRVSPRNKVRPGRAADHSPPSSAAVMEEQSYTSTHPLGYIGPVTGSLQLFLRPYAWVFIRTFQPFQCLYSRLYMGVILYDKSHHSSLRPQSSQLQTGVRTRFKVQ